MPRPTQRVPRTTLARLAALALTAVLAACAPDAADEEPDLAPTIGAASGLADLPPGVALVIDGRPIEIALLDQHADALALTRPQDTRDALLRRALADHVLSRVSMATYFAEARPAALAASEALAARLRAGESVEGARQWEGYMDELDPWLRVALLEAAPGEVLGPIEKADGGFVVAVVTRAYDPEQPVDQVLGVDGWIHNYAEPPVPLPHQGCAGLEARFAERRWRDLVPTAILHALDLGGPGGS